MTIKELVAKAYDHGIRTGLWDPPPSFAETIAGIQSELSEAYNEYRNGSALHTGEEAPPVYYSGEAYVASAPTEYAKKPEGYAVELADAVIWIADLCGYMGIDLEAVIEEKMAYNETRPPKHGKRF